MNPAHNPESIRNAYLGPVVDFATKGRITRKFSDNLAAAFVPDQLIWNALNWTSAINIETVMLKPVLTTQLWIDLADSIEDQFEMRISIFWKQALFLYLTRFNLVHYYAADAQIGMAAGSGEGKYDCAHMATLSALRVLMPDNTIVALGQGSSFHFDDNATAWLPKDVNQLDCQLDFQSKVEDRTFRNTAICILQSVSFGLLTPYLSMGWFLRYAYLHLESIMSKGLSPEKLYIAQRYVEVIRCFNIMYNEDGMGLIKKLTYSGEIDERPEMGIYMNEQMLMHQRFIYEMSCIRQMPIALTQEGSQAVNPFFKQAIAYCTKPAFSTTVNKYAHKASLNENVRNAVRNFLAHVASGDEFYQVLRDLYELKNVQSLALLEFAVRGTIDTKHPHRIPHILYLTIEKVVDVLSGKLI